MATILSLKRRIQASQNVSKTTKAMQMISASKLKRAQNAAVATRPYVERLTSMTQMVARNIDQETFSHPYLTTHTDLDKTLLIVLAPDKGLCGALITNLLKEFLNYHAQSPHSSYIVLGKKVEGQVIRVAKDVIASFPFGTVTPTFDAVYPIIKLIDEYYLGGKVGSVKILSTHFTSFFTQTPKVTTILPVALPEEETGHELPYLFEPSVETLLPSLLTHYIEMSIYQLLIESFVSEQASRMLSMQNATDNANDIIEDLRLEYNKTRQAKITSELLDITGASAATAEA